MAKEAPQQTSLRPAGTSGAGRAEHSLSGPGQGSAPLQLQTPSPSPRQNQAHPPISRTRSLRVILTDASQTKQVAI